MIKIQIKHYWTGEILFEYSKDNNTIKDTVQEAVNKRTVLRGADLRDADLRDADLRGAVLRGAVLRGAVLSGADLRGADLRDADLSDADLRDAVLRDADLRGADLRGAVLRGADLTHIKNDFWAKLLKLKNEIPAFKEKIKEGQINGSCYEGACCCFVGTFANIKGVNYQNLEGVYPDSGSPTEKWFMGFKEGDKPENSQIAKITLEWIEEFEMYLAK